MTKTPYQRGYFLGAFSISVAHELLSAFKSPHEPPVVIFGFILCAGFSWLWLNFVSGFITDPQED